MRDPVPTYRQSSSNASVSCTSSRYSRRSVRSAEHDDSPGSQHGTRAGSGGAAAGAVRHRIRIAPRVRARWRPIGPAEVPRVPSDRAVVLQMSCDSPGITAKPRIRDEVGRPDAYCDPHDI